MREAILAIYQDRKNLAATLKDTKTVVGTLERIMAVVIQLAFFFIYLLIWNVRCRLEPCHAFGAWAIESIINTLLYRSSWSWSFPDLPSTYLSAYA
jgi:hypothetical protein